MSILRNKIKSDFSQIPNNLITDSRLSHGAKLVAIYLMSKPDGWQVLNADIMKNLNISKPHTIAGYWRELIASGWVLRIPRKDDGSKFLGGFDYEIIGFVLTETEMPKNRNAENGQCGKTEMPKMGIHNNTEYINNTDLGSNTDLSLPSELYSERTELNTNKRARDSYSTNKIINQLVKEQDQPLTQGEGKSVPTPQLAPGNSTINIKGFDGFERFWGAYPAKQRLHRASAYRSWQMQGLWQHADRVCEALELWKKSKKWQADGGKFIPYPDKFLGEEYYSEDSLAAMQAHGQAEKTMSEILDELIAKEELALAGRVGNA